EVDSTTRSINRLLIPQRTSVSKIIHYPSGKKVDIELSCSETRYFLDPEKPHFQFLLNQLEIAKKNSAEVIVTDTQYKHEIIHVKETGFPFVLELLPLTEAQSTVE